MTPSKNMLLFMFLLLGMWVVGACTSNGSPKEPDNPRGAETESATVPIISTRELLSTRVPRRFGTPDARSHAAMVYDSQREVIVLFGGVSNSDFLNDTWEYDGNRWYQVETAVSPPARVSHEMAYDPERGVTILFGGEVRTDFDGTQYLKRTLYGDLWEYDGQEWRQIQAAEMPSPRIDFVMGYYPLEKAVFIASGYDPVITTTSGTIGDAWLYDGTFWPGGINHQGSRNDKLLYYYFNLGGPEMVYDTNRQKLIIMWGQLRYGTLEFDDTAWEDYPSTVVVSEDPERYRQQDYALSYDQHRGVTVLFGGLSAKAGADSFPLNDTWEYDGETWKEMAPATAPPPRSGHMMVYDEARQVIVLFGGRDADINRLNDTWEYDGVTWVQKFLSESSD